MVTYHWAETTVVLAEAKSLTAAQGRQLLRSSAFVCGSQRAGPAVSQGPSTCDRPRRVRSEQTAQGEMAGNHWSLGLGNPARSRKVDRLQPSSMEAEPPGVGSALTAFQKAMGFECVTKLMLDLLEIIRYNNVTEDVCGVTVILTTEVMGLLSPKHLKFASVHPVSTFSRVK